MQSDKPISLPHTIYDLIAAHARQTPQAVAIASTEQEPLTYRALQQQIDSTVETIRRLGIVRNDPVAIVLPNGPEMATAFLAVACAATSAPLNPNYRTQEFDFYLADMSARALITLAGADSAAVEAAQQRNVPVIELAPPAGGAAGQFTLTGRPQPAAAGPVEKAAASDTALVLHTSGTTSRPKMVPLQHSNLCASAAHIRQTLQLTAANRCLNIMPLFHIHGLMAALLSSLAAGASVVCTPGFYAPQFFGWLEKQRPTWYTAVPTMHQAILARAEANRPVIEKSRLRFVRSSSASLPPSILNQLEQTFGVPVIEAYGMTEASHQMTCNPLPPGARKAGSVGPAAGPEVAIMNEEKDALLAQGEIGEVVIRGPNVTRGYANNPEANQKAFTAGGWFRTGDQGRMDLDGYLHLTGRLKELINRGGEKISPREVDEVLLAHPDVVQAVTFAMPDERLGEDVAAAVILREGSTTTGQALRRYAAQYLADFKVPQQVVLLDEIPKGPTGKLQRIGLAEKLGLSGGGRRTGADETAEFVAPRSEVEQLLAEIWAEVLNVEDVSVHHRFLELGGDSVTATRLVARLRQMLQLELTLLDFFEAPTIAQQALIIEERLLE